MVTGGPPTGAHPPDVAPAHGTGPDATPTPHTAPPHATGPETTRAAPDPAGPARGSRVGRLLRAAVLPLVLVALVALAGTVLSRVYADDLLTRLVVGAAAGSVLVSVAARRLRSWLVAPVSVAALAGYTLWSVRLAAHAADLPGGLAEVTADAARNAIPRLLTAMIPVEPTPDTVLVPLVAAWLAGLAAAEVALRAGRVLLGYLPPAALFAGALYVVGPNADPAIWPAVAFVAVAAVGLAVPGGSPTGPGGSPTAPGPATPPAVRARLAVASATGVVLVVAATAVVGPAVAALVDRRPVDPRRYVEPPQVDSLDENPLIRISGWALNPDQRLLEVDTTRPGGPAGGSTPPRIRLAVLSDYDGVTWRVGATYRNAGRILPATEPAPHSTVDEIRQEITVADLSGRLLPAVPTPREVTGARVAYDPQTGTLIRPEGLTPGLRYTVTSARENPDVNLLATADVPAGDAVARVLRVADGVPDPLGRLATQLAEENSAPYARASAIEQFLAEHYRVVADAPSGHAYPNLEFFLVGPRNGGGQQGTSEQFAAAFAVLGRLCGLPTRVVVGFRPRQDGPVRAADAMAWPEVLFDGLGWVPFDPMPRPDEEPRPVEEDFRPRPEQTPPPDVPEPTLEPSPTPPPAAGPDRGADPRGLPAGVVVAGLTGGLLLVAVGVLLVLAGLRRSTSRTRLAGGDPGQRIAGAWREVTDALRLAGHPVGGDLAATEVAEHAARVLAEARDGVRPDPAGQTSTAGAGVVELAGLLNQVGFAPGTATPEQADRAVRTAREYAASLRAARPRWRRLLWSVHPGPLRWPR
ncbi:transglutaminaseTgpA domain-containing protein [Micromonospora rosaria]